MTESPRIRIKWKGLVIGSFMKEKLKNKNHLYILLISVSTVLPWCSLNIGNTFLWWLLDAWVLYYFFKSRDKSYDILAIACFFVMLGISVLYSVFYQAENYWDYKMMVSNIMVFCLPVTSYMANDTQWVGSMIRYWMKYAIWVLIILFPFLSSDAYGKFLVPFTLFALFYKYLNRKYIVFVLGAYVVTVILGQSSRSDIFKFSVCLILGIITLIPLLKSLFIRSIKILHIGFFIVPVVLLVLGLLGIFNVFNIAEQRNIENKYIIGEGDKQYDALVDTRTGLYVEEIRSAVNNNYIWQGRSISRGYASMTFGETIQEQTGWTGRMERQKCEVSILNVFNYFGLIGVALYCFIFFQASFLAIYKSKNGIIPIIGLYVSFRWFFAFIEDFSNFDLNYMFFWLIIGMCYSPNFRNMTDGDIKLWIDKIIR